MRGSALLARALYVVKRGSRMEGGVPWEARSGRGGRRVGLSDHDVLFGLGSFNLVSFGDGFGLMFSLAPQERNVASDPG